MQETAQTLYEELTADGVEVLWDERDESLGAKFKDADLIGLPLRITLTPRSMQNGGVELRRRDGEETIVVPVEEAANATRDRLVQLWNELGEGVVKMPFDG